MIRGDDHIGYISPKSMILCVECAEERWGRNTLLHFAVESGIGILTEGNSEIPTSCENCGRPLEPRRKLKERRYKAYVHGTD